MKKYKDFCKKTLKAKKCSQCTYGILKPTYCKCALKLYKLLTQNFSIKKCKQYKKIKISKQDF